MGGPRKCSGELRTSRPAAEPRDGPTRNFHEEYEKLPPGQKCWNPKKIPPKYRKKHPEWALLVFWGCFFGIFSAFWWSILGVQNFGPGGTFSALFVEIPGRPIWGLCGRSGRPQPASAFGVLFGDSQKVPRECSREWSGNRECPTECSPESAFPHLSETVTQPRYPPLIARPLSHWQRHFSCQ